MTATADPLLSFRHAICTMVRTDQRDLSARQLAVLLHLARSPNPAPSVKDLAEAFNIAKPAVTRALDRLELDLKLAKREDDPGDRRKVRAVITESGRAYVDAIEAALREVA